jgi:flavodoxin
MKTVVVYDSMFGNTEKIAQAVGGALAGAGEVLTVRVKDAKPDVLAGAALVVAGTPTHGGRPSPTMKEWLDALPAKSLAGAKVAAFDTRMVKEDIKSAVARFFVGLFGYAADPLNKTLVKLGGAPVVQPEGFRVLDREGPLKDGEIERAAAWGAQVLAAANTTKVP